MDNTNYEEVLRRRQERRRREKLRRKRKVMMIYMLMFSVALIAGGSAFALWKYRLNHENNQEKILSSSESSAFDESQDAVAAVNPTPETSPDGSDLPGSSDSLDNADSSDSPEGQESQQGQENQEGQLQSAVDSSNPSDSSDTPQKPENIFQRFFAWIGSFFNGKKSPDNTELANSSPEPEESGTQESSETPEEDVPEETQQEVQVPDMNTPEGRLANLLFVTDRLALGYDYDQAIALLKTNEEFSTNPEVVQALERYETEKASLVEYDLKKVTHVFFHSLVIDNARAFDGDNDAKGYNQVMTTQNEFLKILEEMYNRGFVLVRLHDMAHEEMDENGNVRMVKGKIMLPEGKQAFVMSQDDVCYYPYMNDDGFAKRIIIGENGKPTCVMELEDKTEVVGSYDLVPLLEDFIQLHPDFSYKGARAVIAFTGYEGILGYRTAASYQDKNPNYEADRQQAALVAQCLRDNGWELASHSWGHRYLGQIDFEKFVTDSDKWEAEVESIIGPTDIILFPFGDDIGDWHGYASDNDRFNYLYSLGFRYFCNVDSAQYWVQFGDTYMRQGRRNLDGFRMWQDIVAGQEGRTEDRKLDDLFRAEDVFDPARPTPVEWE